MIIDAISNGIVIDHISAGKAMKLDENERANTIRLMKVKDMILQEAIEERRQTDAAEGAGV